MDPKKLELENLENLSEIEVLTEDELDGVVGGTNSVISTTTNETLAILIGIDASTIDSSDFV